MKKNLNENIYTTKHKGITWTNFADYCKGCGLCIERCPKKCLKFSDNNFCFLGTPSIECEVEKCIVCGICEKNCPDSAIIVEKKNIS